MAMCIIKLLLFIVMFLFKVERKLIYFSMKILEPTVLRQAFVILLTK